MRHLLAVAAPSAKESAPSISDDVTATAMAACLCFIPTPACANSVGAVCGQCVRVDIRKPANHSSAVAKGRVAERLAPVTASADGTVSIGEGSEKQGSLPTAL